MEGPKHIELTREELYARVWSEPGSKLAPQLGVSDVGLAKTCRRLGVPRPPRGYWNRLAAGQKVKRLPLPPAKDGQDRKANFIMSTVSDSSTAARPRPVKPQPLALPSDSAVLGSTAKALLAAIRAAAVSEQGRVTIASKVLPRVICSADLAERAAGAVHILITEATARGISVEAGSKDSVGVAFTKNGDMLHVEVEEPNEEVACTNVDKRRPSWKWQTKTKKPSGRLCIRLSSERNFYGRRLWTEKGGKDLEHILPQVIARMEEIFQSFVEERVLEAQRKREREAQERRDAEQRKRRLHQEHLDGVVTGRVNVLRRAAQWWQIHESILRFVDQCEKQWRDQQAGHLTTPQEDWLVWARQNAKAFSPLRAGYPDPELDGNFNPDDVPFGGPYPQVRKMPDPHPKHVEHQNSDWRYQENPAPDVQFPFWLLNRRH